MLLIEAMRKIALVVQEYLVVLHVYFRCVLLKAIISSFATVTVLLA